LLYILFKSNARFLFKNSDFQIKCKLNFVLTDTFIVHAF